MRQMTVQPTVFRLFGTPKATSKETEEEKTSSVVWYSSSRVGGRKKKSSTAVIGMHRLQDTSKTNDGKNETSTKTNNRNRTTRLHKRGRYNWGPDTS